MKTISAFTDGSCTGNGTLSACGGYGIHFSNNEFDDISEPFLIKPITNQRTELYAIYVCLKMILESDKIYDKINIYTDSNYSLRSVTIWIKNWKKNGWKVSNGNDVKNLDIIKPIDELLVNKRDKIIDFIHIKAHSKDLSDWRKMGNYVADELACKGTEKCKSSQLKNKNLNSVYFDTNNKNETRKVNIEKKKKRVRIFINTETD